MADDATTNQGYGQQDPSDSSNEYNERDFHILARLASISTLKLVKVIAVNAGAFTVDVQIMVNQLDGQNNSTPHGTINSVPYLYFQCGNGAIMADPVVGDQGLMGCCDRDISAVLATKKIGNPGSFRKLSAMDGIYICGLPGINAAAAQFVKFTSSGMQLQDKNGNSLVSSAGGWKFTGNVTFENNLQLAGNIESDTGGTYTGSIKTSGNIIAGFGGADQVGLQTHTHISGVVGGGTSPPISGT